MKTFMFDYDNVPGIASMYAIPVDSFVKSVYDMVTGTCTVSLTNEDEIIQIPVYCGDSFVVKEVQSLEDGGELWNVDISGIIPKRCALSEKEIRILERGEWLALTQDSNGCIVLSGTKEVPLKFEHSRTTGTSGEMNGSSFAFHAKESEPSCVLSMLPEFS